MLKPILKVGLLLLILAGPCFAGIKEGEVALEAGDYATALMEFRPLAEQGDSDAQYYLAEMYLDGLGVPQDDLQFVQWSRRSADQGNEKDKIISDSVTPKAEAFH